MKLPALSRDQVRRVDQVAIEQYLIPGIVLMENAGRGAAEKIHSIAPAGWIAILCGGGNNAGDGYVIARHLQLLGRDARILALVSPDELRGDARTNAAIAQRAEIPIQLIPESEQWPEKMADASTVVDALLGTGARGPLRTGYAQVVAIANRHSGMRIAIDIPTGLDCDSGQACQPTFRADHTLTFVATKIGFQRNNADEFVGVVHEIGIGVPEKLLRQLPLGQP
ncbi:MAG: NAD(P)H-hydrate epimerase [Rubripirellula sp.]